MIQSRAERLALNMESMDAVAIMNATEPFLDSTFQYLTGCSSGSFEGARAVVLSDGTLHTFVSILEEESASLGKGNVHVYRNDSERIESMREILNGCKNIGVNFPCASYGSVEWLKKVIDCKIIDASSVISKTMSVKDSDEIKEIENACKITSSAANMIPELISEGISEKSAASELDIFMLRKGGNGNAFPTIAAFGPASSEPHHSPSSYELKNGDVALFDFGCKYGLYCSDLTRTVFLNEPADILKRAYEVVKKAQIAGISEIYAGNPAKNADLAARNIIDSSEFKGKFIHSFGHGIGMNVHEPISLSPKSDQILEAGNVVSAEPGIYLPGIGGIRIEDTVLVTEDGCRVLTCFDKELTII